MSSPPKWADRLLVKICPDTMLEEIQGDLHEAYFWRIEDKGRRHATIKFIIEVLLVTRFYKPKIMKNSKFALLKNYMKTGLRFLWKTRNFSSLNILGLVVGITTCWMCLFYLNHETSYDVYHQNIDRLYRTTQEVVIDGDLRKFSGASYIMGDEYPSQIPQIAAMTRFKSAYGIVHKDDENVFEYMHFADPAIFKMLDFNLLEGNFIDFGSPDNILISSNMAVKFSTGLGEMTITFRGQEKRFNVIGVYEAAPFNSTVRPNFILPFSYYATRVESQGMKNWHNFNMNALVMLNDPADKVLVEEQMTEILQEGAGEEDKSKMILQPYRAVHLDTSYYNGNGLRPTADKDILWIAGIVGLLCLLISAINYANYAMSNYLVRSREVAIRKVVGAYRGSVFWQFVTESMLSTTIAALLAIVAIFFLMPFFLAFVDREYLAFHQLFQPKLIIGAILTLIIVSLISGLYPAVVLSHFKVRNMLSGRQKLGGTSVISKAYLTLQFGLAIALIIGTFAASRQFDYLIDFDLGYQDERVMSVNITRFDEGRLERFEQDLESIPGVKSFAANSSYNGTDFHYEGQRYETRHIVVSHRFIPVLNIELKKGRNFDPNLQSDMTKSAVVNETFVNMLGLTDPIGKQIPFQYGNFNNPTIIGVVKDFHFNSPKYEKKPLIMYQSPEYVLQNMLIKLDDQADSDAVYWIEKAWKKEYAPFPIDLVFMEDDNKAQMQVEQRVKKIATTGSLLSMFLAGLGLLSMVGVYVNQRMKETCIRKITGATARDLYLLYAKKFVIWILAGFALGCLPAYYLLSEWLSNYPNRIDLSIDFAILALLVCMVVFVLIMTMQLSRVVVANPVVFLRDE